MRSPSPRTPTRTSERVAITIGSVALSLIVAIVACDPSTDEEAVPSRVLLTDAGIEAGIVGDGASCAAIACGDGGACCSGSCTAPAWDPQNCGGCGLACAATSENISGACVQGICVDLGRTGVGRFPSSPAELVLSGSVLYADLPAAAGPPISAIDLGGSTGNTHAVPIFPTLLPTADGRGGLYYFESPASGHLLVMHYDYATNVATLVDDLGAGALPHVLVRQGASVARVFSPVIGVIRTVCSNGTVHDLTQTTGVAYGVADDAAVYFGFGSPVTPAVRVGCEAGGAVTDLSTTFGHVIGVDAMNTYWFGVDRTMDASPIAGIYASAKDGATRARLIAHPPVSSSLVTFPLLVGSGGGGLTGSTLYLLYGEHLPSGTPISVLAAVDVTGAVSPATIHPRLSSASPIALDPAFAYTTAAQGGPDESEGVYRAQLSP